MSEELPEYLELLTKNFPEFKTDALIIANIGYKINRHPQTDLDHTNICINQCRVCWELLNSIACLVAYDFGLGAMSLCRNLFELVAGAIYLTRPPEKIYDFVDYGKTIAYELAESVGAEPEYLSAFKKISDYENLKKRFGKQSWHRMSSIRDLVTAAGMEKLYGSFYKEASAIAHGDSFVTLKFKDHEWQLTRDIDDWRQYCAQSLDFSFALMATLYHQIVYTFGLPYEREVRAVMDRLMQKGLL